MPSKGMLASQGEEVIAGLFGASDETIVANDRLYVVPRPTMLLIDLKIKIADIADHNKKKYKSGCCSVLVNILLFPACQTRSNDKKTKWRAKA